MDTQEQHLRLVDMPVLVLEKILSNIHNPSNISRTCKYLYEIVCGMEKRRCVLYISAHDVISPLNTDAVFDSIMNSHRKMKEIHLRLDGKAVPSYELNKQQFWKITFIMEQFDANVTSLKIHGFMLPINFILELLQWAPKLESLSLTWGRVFGSVTENATLTLRLPNLKALDIDHFRGLSAIANLIPAGSLSSICYTDHSTDSTDVLLTILAKQHNIKCLTLKLRSNSDLTALRVDRLQLEVLILESWLFDSNSQFVEIFKWQTNLKELRFVRCVISGSSFQWICYNLKKLEVFEVQQVVSIEGNAFEMLGELKQLRHFSAYLGDCLFINGFQSSQFKSDTIEKFEIVSDPEFRCGELLTQLVDSMAHNLPNLTHLRMKFENFSALCFVLRHCTKIIHLTCYISDLIPDQITSRFPNIQSLDLHNCNKDNNISGEMMSKSLTSIVRAIPNLKSLSLSVHGGLKFDVKTMKEFIKESWSLEYFYVDGFVFHPELSTDDVVETIRGLTDQLKGYHIKVSPSTSPADLNFHKIKNILCNQFYVRYDYRNMPSFDLQKGEVTRYRSYNEMSFLS